jgi:hypothetical protein
MGGSNQGTSELVQRSLPNRRTIDPKVAAVAVSAAEFDFEKAKENLVLEYVRNISAKLWKV